jgi:hypothetical protein
LGVENPKAWETKLRFEKSRQAYYLAESDLPYLQGILYYGYPQDSEEPGARILRALLSPRPKNPIQLRINDKGQLEAGPVLWKNKAGAVHEIEKPSFGAAIVPIKGSVADAEYAIATGRPFEAGFYNAMAVLDVTMVRSLIQLTWKGGAWALGKVTAKEAVEVAPKLAAKGALAEFAEALKAVPEFGRTLDEMAVAAGKGGALSAREIQGFSKAIAASTRNELALIQNAELFELLSTLRKGAAAPARGFFVSPENYRKLLEKVGEAGLARFGLKELPNETRALIVFGEKVNYSYFLHEWLHYLHYQNILKAGQVSYSSVSTLEKENYVFRRLLNDYWNALTKVERQAEITGLRNSIAKHTNLGEPGLERLKGVAEKLLRKAEGRLNDPTYAGLR